ncbi:DNA mismatch repair protein msh6 [Crucibulum laeve]|uniref:DNA mismatch repair protein n=1 Tax=Crucibulum laeve TaxID=68775 RepID=A0A5C3LYM0_9AGAR|nr:DNA mismatch repair protein msh6 [Crucibulum laeve]
MPPKPKAAEPMKQKSLTAFFSKGPNASASAKPGFKAPDASKSKTLGKSASSSSLASESASKELPPSSPMPPKTPIGKAYDRHALQSSVAASTTSCGASTPPSSDPIDVDMLSDDDEQKQRDVKKSITKPTGKRKVVIEDSDEEITETRPTKHRDSSHRNSSPTVAVQSRAKKQRLSVAMSEDEDEEEAIARPRKRRLSRAITDEEDEDDDGVPSSFSERLTQFKKSPAKKGRNSRASSDDDDFIIPSDDSDTEIKSIKSSSSRSSRSKLSSEDDFDEDEDEDSGKKSKPSKSKASATKKSAGRASKKASAADASGGSGGGGTGFSFLTAAEQREQGKKDEKKAAESPYGFLVNIKDKDGRKPGQEGYDPRTLYIPSKAWAEFTPFEKQFWEIKQNHYDTILFFQKGKFFELYEDDARIGHQEFDLKLTSRVKMSMVGVPEMSFNFWVAKFLGKGYKVGRVEQSETALGAEMRMAASKGKGKVSEDKGKDKIVRRELNKVYTNGTLIDAELLTDEQAGHCIAISETPCEDGSNERNTFGICVLDCATSQFNLSAFQDDICRTKLETLMRQVRAKELVFKKGNLSVPTTRLLKSILPAACLWTSLRSVEGFTYSSTLEELKSLYKADEDEDMMDGDEADSLLPTTVPSSIREMASSKEAIESLGSMIWYLRQLNIDKHILSMRNFNIYDPMKRGEGLTLDGQTLAHIEVLQNNEGTEDGTLLKLLGRCVTPFGKRLFRIWLCMPLREISTINARQDAVQDIMNYGTFEAEFTELAKGLPDLERIVSRIHAKNCRIKDFLKVLVAFKKLSRGMNKLADASEGFESKSILGLLRGSPDLLPHVKHVEDMYQPISEKDTDELVPRKGKDEAYDTIMAEIEGLEKEFDDELEVFEEQLEIKLSFWHSAQGNKEIYLIETPASFKKVPKDWTKTNSTKAKARYIAGSLQKKVRQLKEARENRNTAIKAFKSRLFAEFDTDRAVWLRAIRVFAELDCLVSLAKSSSAIGEPACRPEFVDDEAAWVDFEQLRHPTLLLSTSLKTFIPNDVKLGGDVGKIALLTGPNMAGKSTVMRMTATGVIMAQLGMLVPASRARLSPVDAIITRMGAYDNMFSNASTFKVELDECCKILRDATPKSLVILDELGRGTSTYDGMAIAGAVLHQLATHTLSLSFFATHYGSLTDDFSYHPNIRNMHMSTMINDERQELVFLFKLIKGVAESSFGTHVANIAGVPLEVVERADVISKKFAQQFKERIKNKQKSDASSKLPIYAQADFAYLVKLAAGQFSLPEDPIRQKEVLMRLKATARRYVEMLRS